MRSLGGKIGRDDVIIEEIDCNVWYGPLSDASREFGDVV